MNYLLFWLDMQQLFHPKVGEIFFFQLNQCIQQRRLRFFKINFIANNTKTLCLLNKGNWGSSNTKVCKLQKQLRVEVHR